MSKYGTKNNENFSKSKYFANSSNANNTVIRKNLTESPVSSNAKYTQNIYAKPVNQENLMLNKKHSEPLSSVTRANKYNIIEKPMIQKRDNSYIQKSQHNIQKAEGIWGNITDWLKNFLEEQKKQRDELYGIVESGVKSADSGTKIDTSMPYIPSAKKVDPRTAISEAAIAPSGRIAPSGSGAVTAAREGATRVPRLDIDLLRRDLGSSEYPIWEDAFSTGGYRGTVHPDQYVHHLADVNPAAHDALLRMRKQDGTSLSEPISESEAIELLDYDRKDYTSAAFEPGWDWEPSPSISSAENRFARLYASDNHPEDMLDAYYDAMEEFPGNRKPWSSLTAEEKEEVKLGMDDYYNDVIVPAKFDIDDIPDSFYLTDKKSGGIATEAKESTPEVPLKTEESAPEVPVVARSFPSTSSRPSGRQKVTYTRPKNLIPKIPDPAEGDVGLSFGLTDINPGSRKSGRKNISYQPAQTVMRRFDPGYLKMPQFKTLNQKQIPFDESEITKPKKLTNAQRMALAATALTAAGVAHHFATKPTTTIPDVPKPINPTGNWKLYGNNKGEKVGGPEDWTDRWAPGDPGTPSNDFWRPLVQGYKGGTPEYQTDKEGDYMYVRSPYPYAPNDTSVNRKNNKLTTRGREEMWRFGGDLQDVLANKWSGKGEPIPDDK